MEIFGVFALGLLIIAPFWIVISKTGNPGVLSLLLLIPLINIIVILYLAISEWPIETEVNELKAEVNRLKSKLHET